MSNDSKIQSYRKELSSSSTTKNKIPGLGNEGWIYEEVDKLASQTSHIEAIRNELWNRNCKPTNKTD